MSNEATNVFKKVGSLDVSPRESPYTKVAVIVGTNDEGQEVRYEAGEDGLTLEIKNPWGTQEMADSILQNLQGFQYQPYKAGKAHMNPATELGDGISVNDVYSGVYITATNFSRLMLSDVEAPQDEEIEHEFATESASDRQYTRFVQQTKGMLRVTNLAIQAEVEARTTLGEEMASQFAITATEINAKVSKSDHNSGSTFGWNLTADGWTVYSGSESNVILRATSAGLEVKGAIKADSGYIGGEQGFVITSNAIYKNLSAYGGSQSTGVYIGTNGIQLGQNFKVDSSGNLSASNASFSGSVNCTSLNVASNTGCTIGGSSFSGSSLASCIAGGGNFNAMSFQNTKIGLGNFSQCGCDSLFVGTPVFGTNQASWRGMEVVTAVSHSQNRRWSSDGYWIVTNVALSVSKSTIHYLGCA